MNLVNSFNNTQQLPKVKLVVVVNHWLLPLHDIVLLCYSSTRFKMKWRISKVQTPFLFRLPLKGRRFGHWKFLWRGTTLELRASSNVFDSLVACIILSTAEYGWLGRGKGEGGGMPPVSGNCGLLHTFIGFWNFSWVVS